MSRVRSVRDDGADGPPGRTVGANPRRTLWHSATRLGGLLRETLILWGAIVLPLGLAIVIGRRIPDPSSVRAGVIGAALVIAAVLVFLGAVVVVGPDDETTGTGR